MRKLATLLILCAGSFMLLAQPTLDIDNFHMNNGETYAIHQVEYQTPSASGSDLMWDYGSLALTPVDTFEVVDPSSSIFGANFPSADVAIRTTYDVHVYYSQGDSGVFTQGNASTSAWTAFSDPKMHYLLPATLNSTGSDDYYKITDNGNGGQTISEGTTTITSDAYGTLSLPFGTFNDVLRFVRTEDNILVTIADGDTTYSSITLIQHFFLCEQSGWALLELNETIVDGVSYYGAFATEPLIITKVHEQFGHSSLMEVFPNPASRVANVLFESELKEDWELNIYDFRGKEVFDTMDIREYHSKIDLSMLEAGGYILEVRSKTGERIQQVLILE